MAAGRHNLTRRAVLGAGVGACVVRDSHLLTVPTGQGSDPGSEEAARAEGDDRQATVRWTRTLAAYRRAEARVASFKAAERLLPPPRRAFPACEPLEEEFGRLDSLRLAALRRLFRLPAPDLRALALKLALAVADQAWELNGCESCLSALAEDARRLAATSP